MKKNNVKKIFAQNIVMKAASVVIALLVWLVVMNISDPVVTQTFSNINVMIINQDEVSDAGKVFEILDETGVVTIKVKARRSLKLKATDFRVVADMENLNFMNAVPMVVSCSNPLVSVDQITVNPASLKVSLENKAEQEFVISVDATGTPAQGYEVGNTSVVNGKTIRIAGSEALLNIIGKVVVSVPVEGVSENIERYSGKLKIIDKNGETFTETQMSSLEIKTTTGTIITDSKVEVNIALWRVISGVALKITTNGEPADGYEVTSIVSTPDTVSLAGTDQALEALDGALTVNSPIDITGATGTVEATLEMPDILDGYENLRQASGEAPEVYVKIQIEAQGNEVLQVPISEIVVLNKPEGKNIFFTPADKMSVTVRKTDSTAKDITAAELKGSMDLSNCSSVGNYDIPVTFQIPKGYELVTQPTIAVDVVEQETQLTEAQTE